MNAEWTVSLNAWGASCASWMMGSLIEATLLLGLLSLVWLIVRRRASPQFGYCLFLLLFAKLLLPIPIPVSPGLALFSPRHLAEDLADRLSPQATPPAYSHEIAVTAPNADSMTDFADAVAHPRDDASTAVPDASPAVFRESLAEPQLSWKALLMLGWACAVTALAARFCHAQWRAMRSLAVARPIGASALAVNVEELQRRIGVRRTVRLVESDAFAGPAVAGVFRPILVLPSGLIDRLSPSRLAWVVMHELSHVKRWDVAVMFVQRWIQIVYFFNPAVWIANWLVNQQREYACDDMASAASSNDAKDCGAAFLDVVEGMSRTMRPLAPVLPMIDSFRSIQRRLARLLDDNRRLRMRLSRSAIAVLILSALAFVPWLRASDEEAAAEKPSPTTIRGVVRSGDKPIAGATVYVWSAGVRVGTSTYCPTCYADCGKHAETNERGEFSIAPLDATLVFKILAVADGHQPQFVGKVDPAENKDVEISLQARPTLPDDSQRIVRGQVFGPNGRPAARAVVEPFGCKTKTRQWYGTMPGVDPLAVTDPEGRFVIVTGEPVEALDLQVKARGALTRIFKLVPAAKDGNRLDVFQGASVRGRVVDEAGKPVSEVTLGLAQVERIAGEFVGAYEIGTDSNGRFLFANIPNDTDIYVYGKMTSIGSRGAIPGQKVRIAGDGKMLDLGDVRIEKGHSLRGRIVLSDGTVVPKHTRVNISRSGPWDSLSVEADDQGNFAAAGIPAELIELHVRVPGYRLSSKNGSLLSFYPSQLQGLMNRDIDDLLVLFEPGEPNQVSPKDSNALKKLTATRDRIQQETIVGVTKDLQSPLPPEPAEAVVAKQEPARTPLPEIEIPPPKVELREDVPADAPRKRITGIVTNPEGKAVSKAEVWLPVRWVGPEKSLTAHSICDDQGQFQLEIPTEWITHQAQGGGALWVYAPGYGIAAARVIEQLYKDSAEACRVSLAPESKTAVVVLKPDGTPAIGAIVEPLYFHTPRGYEPLPAELLARLTLKTNELGRAAIPAMPREKFFRAMVRADGFGKQQFRLPDAETVKGDDRLQIRPVGRIEGRILVDQPELTSSMRLSFETESTGFDHLHGSAGSALIRPDKEGRFTIPEIAEGRMRIDVVIDERLPVRPRLPKWNELEVIGGETTKIDIQLEMCVRVHGIVRKKDTQVPVAGAMISVRYGEGRQGEQVFTDDKGIYRSQVLHGDVYLQAIALPDNLAQLGEPWNEKFQVPAGAQDFELPTMEVVTTRSVTGHLVGSDNKSIDKARVNGVVGDRRYGFGDCNAEGEFTLRQVPEDIELRKFEVWIGRERQVLEAETLDPLVLRLK